MFLPNLINFILNNNNTFQIQFIENGMDSLQIDQIKSEQQQLQRFAQQRQHKFQESLDAYLNHIKKETEQLQSSQSDAQIRNKNISSIFEGVYERIMMGSHILVRKGKETAYQKKVFWENLIATNADMPDLQLKKDFYQQKRDAEDLYYDAIEVQKMKKIPYSDLLGKIKADHSLKHWQDNNKNFEQKVNKQTRTLHQWKIYQQPVKKPSPYTADDSSHFLHQFTQPETNQWVRPIAASNYTNHAVDRREQGSVLKDFYQRKF